MSEFNNLTDQLEEANNKLEDIELFNEGLEDKIQQLEGKTPELIQQKL
jgi:hypothetical protein